MRLSPEEKAELLCLSRSSTMREDSIILRASARQCLEDAPDPGLALLDFLTDYSELVGQTIVKQPFIETEMRL